MEIIIKDKYNSEKIWLVLKSKCRHYSLKQYVKGQQTGSSYRCGKKWIESIIGDM